MLARQGVDSRIYTDVPEGDPDILVVQSKWLLNAADGFVLWQRAQQLVALREAGARLVLDAFDN